MSNNDRQMTSYNHTLPPEGNGWLDITTFGDYATGYKVFHNTITNKTVSYPFILDLLDDEKRSDL